MERIVPTGENILVKEVKRAEKTKGGIILPVNDKVTPSHIRAKVVEVGPQAEEQGVTRDTTVLIELHSARKIEDHTYISNFKGILAVVEQAENLGMEEVRV